MRYFNEVGSLPNPTQRVAMVYLFCERHIMKVFMVKSSFICITMDDTLWEKGHVLRTACCLKQWHNNGQTKEGFEGREFGRKGILLQIMQSQIPYYHHNPRFCVRQCLMLVSMAVGLQSLAQTEDLNKSRPMY